MMNLFEEAIINDEMQRAFKSGTDAQVTVMIVLKEMYHEGLIELGIDNEESDPSKRIKFYLTDQGQEVAMEQPNVFIPIN